MARRHQYLKRVVISGQKPEAELTRNNHNEVDWSNPTNYQTRYSGWGRVLNQASRESLAAAQQWEDYSLSIAVPSCSETRAVKASDRCTLEGSTFEVLGSYDREEQQDEVVINLSRNRSN